MVEEYFYLNWFNLSTFGSKAYWNILNIKDSYDIIFSVCYLYRECVIGVENICLLSQLLKLSGSQRVTLTHARMHQCHLSFFFLTFKQKISISSQLKLSFKYSVNYFQSFISKLFSYVWRNCILEILHITAKKMQYILEFLQYHNIVEAAHLQKCHQYIIAKSILNIWMKCCRQKQS